MFPAERRCRAEPVTLRASVDRHGYSNFGSAEQYDDSNNRQVQRFSNGIPFFRQKTKQMQL